MKKKLPLSGQLLSFLIDLAGCLKTVPERRMKSPPGVPIQHGKRDEPLCHVRSPGSGLGIRRTCSKDRLPFADQPDIRIRKTGDPIRI